MTYREKIQSMIAQINTLYNDAEWLRDFATGEEKEYWNKHRGIFYDASAPLRKLDNSLTQSRANSCLCDSPDKRTVTMNCSKCGTKNSFYQFTCKDCGEKWNRNNYCDDCSEVLEA